MSRYVRMSSKVLSTGRGLNHTTSSNNVSVCMFVYFECA